MNKPLNMPQSLIDLLASGHLERVSTPGAVITNEFMEQGRRNTDLTASAGFFLRKFNLSRDGLQSALLALNSSAEHPLGDDEVTRIGASIEKYRAAPAIEFDETHLSSDLAEHLKASFRHVAEWGWMHFSGGRWHVDKGGKAVQEETKSYLTIQYECVKASAGVDDKDRVKSARAFLSRTKINNLLELASSNPAVSQAVSDFDSKKNVLNVANGTLVLSSHGAELRSHEPADLLTKCADVEYRPDADAPEFDAMLSDALDDENKDFAMRLLGYALTGDADQQVFAVFHGSGANGKSTLTNIVARILGDYAVDVEPATFMVQRGNAIRNDLARTNGARLVLTSEVATGERLDAALLKRFVGGDQVSARFLYKEIFSFRPIGMPIIVTNALPIINGADTALSRRIVLLAFSKIIAPDKRDPQLPHKLWAERSGILNRLLAGATDYLKDRSLRQPEAVIRATNAYIEHSDLLGAFLSDECQLGKDFVEKSSALFDSYRFWCVGQNVHPMSQPQFKNELEKRQGLRSKRTNKGTIWTGLRLNQL